MENIFEVPNKITPLSEIPIPDILAGVNNSAISELHESVNPNNLTDADKLTIEKAIERNAEDVSSIISSQETEMEMWSYDDFDNAYNEGISFEEKQAFTFWIENRLGQNQKGFFKRYSLNRTQKQLSDFNDLDDNTFNHVIKWLRLGAICFDPKTKEYLPSYIYTTGNLWRKSYELKEVYRDAFIDRWGEDAYSMQSQILDAEFLKVYSNRMKVSGVDLKSVVKIDVNSEISNEMKVKTLIFSDGKKQTGNFNVFVGSGNVKEFQKGQQAGKQKNSRFLETPFQELTLRHAFVFWIRHAEVMERGQKTIQFDNSSWEDVYNHFVLLNRKGTVKLDSEGRMLSLRESKRIGENLWIEFLQKGLTSEDKTKLEYLWNEKYNHYPNLWDVARCHYVGGSKKEAEKYTLSSGGSVLKVAGKIPIGFTMAKRYGGDPSEAINDIRTDKRRSLSFNMLTQFQSLLAYGVGVGKTWCAIFQVAQALELGICKRPILVLPNQVYPQFVKEVKSILPQFKVNALFNLRGDFRLLIDLIEDNSITIVTETALEVMGFTEQYIDEGHVDDAQYTIAQTNSGAIPEKEQEALNNIFAEHKSQTDSQGREKVFIDECKWDYLVVDEAHNYKKLITAVKGNVSDLPPEDEIRVTESDRGRESAYREQVKFDFGGSGKPSGRALKLYLLTSYIQQFNKFGNTLLLTATPFTNSPLEVWSMLSFTNKEVLKNANLNASADFFKIFGIVDWNTESTISGSIQIKNTFVGWKNVPALQNLIFTCIDFISPDEVDLKRPNKFVLPSRSVKNEDTQEMRMLDRQEQVSSIITMFDHQKQLTQDLKDYAVNMKDWFPKQYELYKDRGRDGEVNVTFTPVELAQIVEECEENPQQYIACEDNWNTTSLIKEESRIKYLPDTPHKLKVGQRTKTFTKYGSDNKDNKYPIEDLESIQGTFGDAQSTRLLRSLTFQRQVTISPYLFNASGYKTDPTPKDYIESSAKLSYVMGCIASVKKHHEIYETEMSGQIIYMEYGKDAFPLIAQYLIEELKFKPSEVAIICGDKKLTRVMSSVTSKGNPKPQDKSVVQDYFNGQFLNDMGEWEELPDEQRVKVLIGSETISEGMNLQYKSSVIYQCQLPFNPTAQIQLEGRIWRQGNPYKFVRIVNPLCADSIDIFMFQKMQDKTNYINQIWNRNGQTFVIDAKEFDAKELKEACIQNPFVLAKYQVDDMKDDLRIQIREERFNKSRYDNVKMNLEKSVILTFGSLPSLIKHNPESTTSYELNNGRYNIQFKDFLQGSVLAQLYLMLKTTRRDLLEHDLFTDSFYKYVADLKTQYWKQNEENGNEYQNTWNYFINSIYITDSDLNYSIVEILELVRQFLKDSKIAEPYGYSKEALSEIVVGDKVKATRRGEIIQGKVIEYYKEDNAVVIEQEDGREIELNIDNNDVKKVVTTKDSEEEGVKLLTWGTKGFLENLPLIEQFISGQKKSINEWSQDYIEAVVRLDGKGSLDISMLPYFYDYAKLFNVSSYQLNPSDFKRYEKEYDKLEKVRVKFNSGFLKRNTGSYDSPTRYEGTYIREVQNAITQFEIQMVAEGINNISELNQKIQSFDQKIKDLTKEMDNADSIEKLQERAKEIIVERNNANLNGDQSLKEGDWQQRVQDFASLNCLLDMSFEKKNLQVVVEKEEEEVPSVDKVEEVVQVEEEERSDAYMNQLEVIGGLESMLDFMDEESAKGQREVIDGLRSMLDYL